MEKLLCSMMKMCDIYCHYKIWKKTQMSEYKWMSKNHFPENGIKIKLQANEAIDLWQWLRNNIAHSLSSCRKGIQSPAPDPLKNYFIVLHYSLERRNYYYHFKSAFKSPEYNSKPWYSKHWPVKTVKEFKEITKTHILYKVNKYQKATITENSPPHADANTEDKKYIWQPKTNKAGKEVWEWLKAVFPGQTKYQANYPYDRTPNIAFYNDYNSGRPTWGTWGEPNCKLWHTFKHIIKRNPKCTIDFDTWKIKKECEDIESKISKQTEQGCRDAMLMGSVACLSNNNLKDTKKILIRKGKKKPNLKATWSKDYIRNESLRLLNCNVGEHVTIVLNSMKWEGKLGKIAENCFTVAGSPVFSVEDLDSLRIKKPFIEEKSKWIYPGEWKFNMPNSQPFNFKNETPPNINIGADLVDTFGGIPVMNAESLRKLHLKVEEALGNIGIIVKSMDVDYSSGSVNFKLELKTNQTNMFFGEYSVDLNNGEDTMNCTENEGFKEAKYVISQPGSNKNNVKVSVDIKAGEMQIEMPMLKTVMNPEECGQLDPDNKMYKKITVPKRYDLSKAVTTVTDGIIRITVPTDNEVVKDLEVK